MGSNVHISKTGKCNADFSLESHPLTLLCMPGCIRIPSGSTSNHARGSHLLPCTKTSSTRKDCHTSILRGSKRHGKTEIVHSLSFLGHKGGRGVIKQEIISASFLPHSVVWFPANLIWGVKNCLSLFNSRSHMGFLFWAEGSEHKTWKVFGTKDSEEKPNEQMRI